MIERDKLIERVRRAQALIFENFDGRVEDGEPVGGYFLDTDELTEEERDYIVAALQHFHI